jgi:sulfur-carrier protein adenylyltransferase/sulfurtransferase
MLFKQLFSRVKTMEAEEARRWMDGRLPESFTLLDVRNPDEYAGGHIPGAKLIPLAQLKQRLDEIDPVKPVLAYCAVGGRSRSAAKILSKHNVDAISMNGGIGAWSGPVIRE